MPYRSASACIEPGCPNLARGGPRCTAHTKPRPSAAARGYDSKWSKASRAFVAGKTCACDRTCCPDGCNRPADTTDHIIPHRGDMRLFWDRSNWQPLASVPCHSRKTARRDGGFGR